MADKKDEIISMQLDLIRKMTEDNIRRLSDDIWGPIRADRDEEKKIADQVNSDFEKAKNSSDDSGNCSSNVEDTAKKDDPPTTASSGSDETQADKDDVPPKENIDDLLAELDSNIGLGEVKKEVKNLINMAKVYKLRRDNDLPTADMSLHMVFSGNPGTGKTMIARFMARVYHSLGLLSVGKLVEVDRSGLVAGYIGQTAIKTAKVIEQAKGSVLFIDEAYTLTSKTENDFGFEAVDTVLKAMEDNRDDLVVIVAGYIELMEEFIDSNPGLRSRFNKYVDFADYTAEELFDIFAFNCKKAFYVVDDDANAVLRDYFNAVADEAGEFGNARGVRNSFEKILTEQANRIAALDEVTRDDLMKITKSDVVTALYPDGYFGCDECDGDTNETESGKDNGEECDNDGIEETD